MIRALPPVLSRLTRLLHAGASLERVFRSCFDLVTFASMRRVLVTAQRATVGRVLFEKQLV